MLAAGVVLVAVLVVIGCPWPCSREPTTRFLALLDSAPSWQRRLSEDGSSAPGGRLRGLAHQRKEHRRAELLLDSTCGASDARRMCNLRSRNHTTRSIRAVRSTRPLAGQTPRSVG